MTVRLKTRSAAPGLQCRAAGHALLVHPKGRPDPQAVEFTARLAPDPQHTPVVLDLPRGALDTAWEPVARLLADRPGSLRLVFGRATAAEARRAGQRIADHLDRVVLVPDGEPVPTAGGGLFVPIDHGAGWLQLRPGRLAQPESHRYPRPLWEFSTLDRPWATSPYGMVESVPCGVWLRGARPTGLLDGWRRLVETLPADPHVLTVVLGSPGGPAVPLADAIGLWDTLLPSVRRQVRFVPYGPVALPPGAGALGQELADAFGQHVVVCAGLPVLPAAHDAPPHVRGLLADGSPGWQPHAARYRYSPRPQTLFEAPPPELLGVRAPLPALPQVGTGVWEFAAGAVLEIVQSGLWLRPALEPGDGDDVRRLPAPQGYAALLYDRSEPATAERMHAFAQDLLWLLPPEARDAYRIAPADTPGIAAPADHAGMWSLGEPVAVEDGARPGTAARTAPRRPAHLAFWTAAASGVTDEPVAADLPVAAGTPAAGPAPAEPRARWRASARPAGGTADDLGAADAPVTRATTPPAAVADPHGAGPTRPPHRARTESGRAMGPSRPSESLLTSTGPALGTSGAGAAAAASARLSSAPPTGPDTSPSAAAAAAEWTEPGHRDAQAPTGPFGTRATGTPGPDSGSRPGPADGRTPGTPTGDEPLAPPTTQAAPPTGPGRPDTESGTVLPGSPRENDAAPGPALGDGPSPDQAEPTTSPQPGPASRPEPPSPSPLAPPAPPTGEAAPCQDPPAPRTSPSDPAQPDHTPPAPPADAPATPPAPRQDPPPPPAATAPAPPTARPAGIAGIRLESVAPPVLTAAAPPGVADSASPAAPVPAPAAPSGVRMQPVPRAGASAVPQERGMDQEREWVRRTFARQFNAASGTVSRLLSESPGLRGTTRTEESDAFTDLVALRLYLSGDGAALDAAVRTATVGPHVPLARCVAAGLRRLPSHRGASLLRSALHPSERAWYRENDVLTEWAFCTAWARAAEPANGTSDFLIWSLTARRTALVDPAAPERVVFLPGTRFRVLGTDDHDRLLLRELSASESAEDGKARVPLDEIALEGLAQAADGLDTDTPARAGDAGRTPPPLAAAPGLLPRAARKAAAE
ncbi:hypothetical protein ACIGXM_28480 [Kitasatospora sp. NPDC052896]|uniref:hypothetical protein n=1 Tax=Kitasatospora sp. NPDC052896 TaxID=3364061 RepID=UPI0037C92647